MFCPHLTRAACSLPGPRPGEGNLTSLARLALPGSPEAAMTVLPVIRILAALQIAGAVSYVTAGLTALQNAALQTSEYHTVSTCLSGGYNR